MTHVVTESCIKCKYTDCVDVCPVDCFREGPNFLSIDPDECIDCAVCIPECPVNAIYAEEDVPEDQRDFIKLNVDLSKAVALDHAHETPPCRRRRVEGRAGKAPPARTLIPLSAWFGTLDTARAAGPSGEGESARSSSRRSQVKSGLTNLVYYPLAS